MKIRWSNVPIPEAYLAGLVLGAILQIFLPVKLFKLTWPGHAIGWPLILVGIGFSAWSVMEASEVDIESPDALITSGPYVISRNPMYVGWSLLYLGIAFVVNSVWMLVLFPIAFGYIHFVDIPKEEDYLHDHFGEVYSAYQERVRRYL